MARDVSEADFSDGEKIARVIGNKSCVVLESGPFKLNSEQRRLTRNGAHVKLSGRPLQILEMLLRSSGKIVTRAELKEALWPGSARIDTERRLNTAMRALREAVGDTADAPKYIETLRGHGYRWICTNEAAPSPGQSWRFWPRLAAAACLLLALAGSHRGALGEPAFTTEQRELFLRISAIAEENPERATTDLDALIAQRPDHHAANVLRAELAVRAWREAPDEANLTAAKQAVSAMRLKRRDPDIDVLAAELALHADWDWKRAKRLYRRALSINPDHLGARRGLAWLYLSTGMKEKAWAELEKVLSHATLNDSVRADIGWWLIRMEREDLAIEMCRDGVEYNINLLSCRHTALARTGAIENARQVAVTLLERVNAEPQLVASVRTTAAETGYQRFLEWRVENFLPGEGRWFQRAQLQAEAGALEAAMASLEQAYALRDPSMIKLNSTLEFAALATSGKFQAMVRDIYIKSAVPG